jgi:hypothetical protein
MYHGLNDYIFINQEYEIFERCGMGDDEAAEKHAQYLANIHECSIECCQILTTVEPIEDVPHG